MVGGSILKKCKKGPALQSGAFLFELLFSEKDISLAVLGWFLDKNQHI